MIRKMFKRSLPVLLAGIFLTVPAVFAQAEAGPASVHNRLDRRQDRRVLRRDSRQIVRRRERLRRNVRGFGPGSPQARIARRQLRRSVRRYAVQTRDLRRDRRQASIRR